MKLAGRVLVGTGAGSGSGRAVTLEAVRRRARVAAVDLNATTLEETTTLAAADGARPCRGGPYGSVRAMVDLTHRVSPPRTNGHGCSSARSP
jgi:NAD(P)-dependent dehydrogenase (short-subunit alcohol dehydrogenase family)